MGGTWEGHGRDMPTGPPTALMSRSIVAVTHISEYSILVTTHALISDSLDVSQLALELAHTGPAAANPRALPRTRALPPYIVMASRTRALPPTPNPNNIVQILNITY